MGGLERLRKLRLANGYKQKELAAMLGISQPQLTSYERGGYEPDIELLTRIAGFFDTSVDYIVGHTEVERPIEPVVEYALNEMEQRLIDGFRMIPKGVRKGVISLMETLKDEAQYHRQMDHQEENE